MTTRRKLAASWLLAALLAISVPSVAAQQPDATALTGPAQNDTTVPLDAKSEILNALVRLPLAAVLGAALAIRPRRRGTPPRQPAVIQTQIILAIVGAVVMMVVGTNLARAFGVVGAAGLVRYRAKIEDPKDAGVMLSTLAVGLASGVGLYAMAVFSAVFILVALWVIESFEPQKRDTFSVKVKMGKDTDARRADIEGILRRHRIDFELASSSDEEVIYEVKVPLELRRDRVTNALLALDPGGHAAVEWAEKKTKAK